MFLYDIGAVPVEEPFKRVIHQGMILHEGEKMSKTKGNVVNPDDYDSDELKFYCMFIGHYFDGGSWSDQNIEGIRKFIRRFKEWMSRTGNATIDLGAFRKSIYGYTESFKFNKVVSEFMILVNRNRLENLTEECKAEIVEILKIFMPGLTL
jgi:leucyl-tRNA synthetase